MREIKFRAWVKDYYKHKWYMLMVEFPYFVSDNKLHEHIWDSTGEFNGKCASIMQYTGLKDRQETEIYEGDIVAVIYDDGDIDYFMIKWYEFNWCWFHLNGEFYEWFSEDYYISNTTIVGNIYENSKWLK